MIFLDSFCNNRLVISLIKVFYFMQDTVQNDASIIPGRQQPIAERNKVLFNPNRWPGSAGELSIATARLLEQKGYSETARLSTAITNDSVKRAYRREPKGLVDVEGNLVEMSEIELQTLLARMPNAPDKLRDAVVARYLRIRDGMHASAGWPKVGRGDAMFANDNPGLVELMVEAAFYREAQGAGVEYQRAESDWQWSQTEERLKAINYGHQVLREFAELVFPKEQLV